MSSETFELILAAVAVFVSGWITGVICGWGACETHDRAVRLRRACSFYDRGFRDAKQLDWSEQWHSQVKPNNKNS